MRFPVGREALYQTTDQGLWVGRPVELPGSRPLRLEPEIGVDFGGLNEWPVNHVVKVLCFCHPDDDEAMWADQDATLLRLFQTARRNKLEFLLEVIPSKVAEVDDETTSTIIQHFYDLGIYPDWWKLEPFKSKAAWQYSIDAILRNDPRTRGIVVLGLDAPQAELEASFKLAASFDLVKGFAEGRTLFGQSAREWMSGSIDDATAVEQMKNNYAALCTIWDEARDLEN